MGDKVLIGAFVIGDIVFTSSTYSIVGDGDGLEVTVLWGVSVGMDVVAESLVSSTSPSAASVEKEDFECVAS